MANRTAMVTICTCLLGHIEDHRRGECPCTTPVMDCTVHADAEAGRAEAELVTQHVMVTISTEGEMGQRVTMHKGG